MRRETITCDDCQSPLTKGLCVSLFSRIGPIEKRDYEFCDVVCLAVWANRQAALPPLGDDS